MHTREDWVPHKQMRAIPIFDCEKRAPWSEQLEWLLVVVLFFKNQVALKAPHTL